MVTTSTPMRGLVCRISRVASIPLMPGILISIRITSGCSSLASSTACSPLLASPTTSISGSEPNSPRMPSRKREWSSAISTRMDSSMLSHSSWRCVSDGPAGQPGADKGTASFWRPYGAAASQLFGTLTHRVRPHPHLVVLPETPAVIFYLQMQHVGFLIKCDAHRTFARPRMAYYVSHRLLGHVVCGHLYGCRQGWEACWGLHGDVQPVLAVLGRPLAQGRNEAQLIERRWAQGVHRTAHV